LHATFETNNQETYEGSADVRFDTKDELLDFLNKHQLGQHEKGLITSVDKKEKRNYAPKLHSISSLQFKVNKLRKYSPDDVLKIVQSLYEKKLVSYPRTDCEYIGDKEFGYLSQNIDQYKQVANVSFKTHSIQPKKRYVDNAKVDEHYAIIPTQRIPGQQELGSLSQMERNVYQEILITTLGMFHKDYVYEETIIETDIKGVSFKTKGRIEKEKGWRSISLE